MQCSLALQITIPEQTLSKYMTPGNLVSKLEVGVATRPEFLFALTEPRLTP